ncbi:hypothetical protein [Chitinophaga sp. YR573]|uniref:hypothetical protein n=1 Tax=Chitinophaga sp. YR573 TaxID=1881040 RepID=UPI000B7DAD19|nr:hypothetical protein [Chitinophaga sp. YR573]
MKEYDLIAGYKKDFTTKTGKNLKITVCSRWESACQLPIQIEMPIVINMILDAADWSWEQVFTESRRSQFIFRRGLIYFIMVKAGYSLLKLAGYTGKEHTTIINSYRKFENQLESEPLTSIVLLEIMEFIEKNHTYYLDK